MEDDDTDAEWEACKAIDRLWAEAKARAEARPLTPESAALFQADIAAALKDAPWVYGWCGCMGKAPGEPVCRCDMKRALKIDGRYHLITWGEPPVIKDLGP